MVGFVDPVGLLLNGSSKKVSTSGGCEASSWITVSMTGFVVRALLGIGIDS